MVGDFVTKIPLLFPIVPMLSYRQDSFLRGYLWEKLFETNSFEDFLPGSLRYIKM